MDHRAPLPRHPDWSGRPLPPLLVLKPDDDAWWSSGGPNNHGPTPPTPIRDERPRGTACSVRPYDWLLQT